MNTRRALQLLIGAVAFLAICSCASKPPSIFLAVYGKYSNQSAKALQLVNKTVGKEKVKFIDVDPPSGARGPVIIHGGSAKTLANQIAYALYAEFGDLAAVYSLQMGNHSYSNNHIGIYLLDEESAIASDDEIRQSVAIIPSNEYLPAQCSGFDGSMILQANGRFKISGSHYDETSNERKINKSGSYVRKEGQLELRTQDETYVYVEEYFEWSQVSVSRIKLVPVKAHPGRSGVFDFSFIQDVDVVPKRALEDERDAETN